MLSLTLEEGAISHRMSLLVLEEASQMGFPENEHATITLALTQRNLF